MRRLIAVFALGLLVSGPVLPARAQELRTQPTPFSVWLDFEKLSRPNPPPVSLPIWLESVHSLPAPKRDGERDQTIYRLRLRRMPSLHAEVQLRIFFDDRPDALPLVTAWTETGTLKYQSEPLGNGLNLPSSASLNIPVAGVDYVDVTVTGDGRNIRGVFVASLRRVESSAAIDFSPKGAPADPFESGRPATTSQDDLYLYGRVRATLESGTVKLENWTGGDSATWELQLDAQPLAAMVTFEVLGADINFAPELIVNDQLVGATNLQLPDLADPGFRGDVRPFEKDMRFRYTGWLRGQKLIPGSALKPGLNVIRMRLSSGSGPVALRAVELQLKHHWQDFDYTVTP